MRILVAAMPGDGHFNPLTGVAVALRDRGHDVRWYAGPEYAARVDRLGMPCFPYRRATEVMAGNLDELFPERARQRGPRRISFDLDKFFVSQVEHHFEDMVEIREDWRYDVVLCDGGFYAEQLVVEALQVPVCAVVMSSILPGPDDPPPFFGLRPARNPLHRIQHAVVRRMLASGMKAGTTHYNEVLARHGIAPIPLDGFPAEPLRRTQRVFLNGAPGLEYGGYRPGSNAEFVGPLVPARRALACETAIPAPVLAARGRNQRVIAVSQGTVDNADPGKLIVPTIEAFRDSGHVVVATTSGGRTEQLRAEHAGANVVIEDFIDYQALFPHTDVFVTNGGFGSTLAAFLAGVPVVGAGVREGKNDLNARVDHLGLGIDLRSERPRPRRIRRAVDRVLADPSYATRVRRLRDELEAYDPVARIEAVLTDVVASSVPPLTA